MDPRKKLLQRTAAEGVNDRYILPQKYRDRTAHVTTYSSLLLLAEVHVCSDIMWQKGDVNQLIVLGLEEGSPEVVYQSKKIKISTEDTMMPAIPILPTQKSGIKENGNDILYTSEKDFHGNDVQIFSSCSEAHTTGDETFEVNASSSKCQTPDSTLLTIATSVDIIPSLICTTSASVQERVKGYEFMDIFKMPEENEIDTPHTSMKNSAGKDVHIGDSSSCSEKGTTGFEPLEVLDLFKVPIDSSKDASSSNFLTPDPTLLTISTSVNVTPSLTESTRAPAQDKVEGFEFVGNLNIPEEYKTLYDNISKDHRHMATKNVIKFNDAMLLTCVTSLLKILSDMEIVLGAGVSVALLDRWEGFIRDAETLEFNIEWLREGFNRLKNLWKSSFKVDRDIQSHEQVLDAMKGKYVRL
ncbi:hypothetical protein MKX03_003428 [Papaver bracteatum]|nr:hypothetical protein MKX03_003428 [Papaver bracteatum]